MLFTLAPHLVEELLEQLNQNKSKNQNDLLLMKKIIQNSIVKIVVQVNGKVSAVIEKDVDLSKEDFFHKHSNNQMLKNL